ncbi:MAG: FG-GAP-like repeat-containing protein [bacterium]
MYQIKHEESCISPESNCITKFQVPELPYVTTITKQVTDVSNKLKSSGIKQDWYGTSIDNIESGEYNISYSTELNAYQSPNRANNVRFIYQHDGFTAKNRENKISLFNAGEPAVTEQEKIYKEVTEWEIRFEVEGIAKNNSVLPGRNLNLQKFNGSEITIDRNKASVEDENLRVNYTNNKEGMRQDFIVKKDPDSNDKLRVELSAATKLKMNTSPGSLIFCDTEGSVRMKYSDLKVWDADGKILEASFEKKISDNADIKLFQIVVNDENAVYPVTIDPISATPDWSSESNQQDAAFGKAVSSAGDVNNDGFDDVIIGCPFYDNGQTNGGRVFVYYGSPIGLLPVATWTVGSTQTNAQFGFSVSTAGDINNDGYSDIIIGANFYDGDQTDEGRALVYCGSILGLPATPNWSAEGNQSNSQFGWSVSNAGDINNDGFDDVIVGAPTFTDGQQSEGKVMAYYGSAAGLSLAPNWTGEKNQANSNYGISVSEAGDVNNDGYADIIIGANTYDNPVYNEGAAFVYLGSASGLTANSWATESHALAFFAFTGISVSAAGDINNDGFDDVIIGAYAFDNGQTDEGRAFVYYGSTSGLSSIADWTGENDQAYSRFAYSVATAGDVNNDGYSDVIVGSREYDNGQTNEGGAFLYYGSATGLSTYPASIIESNQSNAYLGCSVGCAGDVNGDGFSDVIVGAYLYDNGQTDEGAAFVYYGSSTALKNLNVTMTVQGLYKPNTNTMIRDTVRAYLRNMISPYSIVDAAKSYLSPAGTGSFTFMNPLNNVSYYLILKHRNSIETWSAVPKSFINNSMTSNFTTSAALAFGNNMIQVDASPISFGIYSGDVNQDGSVDASDIILVFNAVYTFDSGYVAADITGDSFVDVADLVITHNSSNNFVNVIRP